MEKKHKEESEDVTKYGEFVTSYFAWIPTEKQKDIYIVDVEERLTNILRSNLKSSNQNQEKGFFKGGIFR